MARKAATPPPSRGAIQVMVLEAAISYLDCCYEFRNIESHHHKNGYHRAYEYWSKCGVTHAQSMESRSCMCDEYSYPS